MIRCAANSTVAVLLIVCVALLASCVSGRAGAVPSAAAAMPQSIRDCDDCAELVVIPAGRFVMGSDTDSEKSRPEGPAHDVRIARPFALGRTEVTVAQFRRFVAATGYQPAMGCRVQERQLGPNGRVEWRDDPMRSWRDPGLAHLPTAPAELDHLPVVCVGRIDALAFASWLAQRTGKRYRLPSEAEWEYAARAGASGSFFWGSNPDNACSYANVYDRSGRAAADFGWGYADCDDGYAELAPVAHYKPNAFGLYDMLGNAWEWTADCYRETYDAAVPKDGQPVVGDATCANWSVRGGGWMTRPSRQRLSFRGRDPNNAHYNYFGFRIARDLDP